MKKLVILLSLIVIALLVAASFIYIQIRPHFSWIDFFIGKVDVLRADKKTEPAEVKMKVYLCIKTKGMPRKVIKSAIFEKIINPLHVAFITLYVAFITLYVAFITFRLTKHYNYDIKSFL